MKRLATKVQRGAAATLATIRCPSELPSVFWRRSRTANSGFRLHDVVEPNRPGLPPPVHDLLQHANHALGRERRIDLHRQAFPHPFCSATIRIAGVLPHDRMLPECGGKIMGKSVHAGSGKNEPAGLSGPPLLNTPLKCSKLSVGECIRLCDLETVEELLSGSIGLNL